MYPNTSNYECLVKLNAIKESCHDSPKQYPSYGITAASDSWIITFIITVAHIIIILIQVQDSNDYFT